MQVKCFSLTLIRKSQAGGRDKTCNWYLTLAKTVLKSQDICSARQTCVNLGAGRTEILTWFPCINFISIFSCFEINLNTQLKYIYWFTCQSNVILCSQSCIQAPLPGRSSNSTPDRGNTDWPRQWDKMSASSRAFSGLEALWLEQRTTTQSPMITGVCVRWMGDGGVTSNIISIKWNVALS